MLVGDSSIPTVSVIVLNYNGSAFLHDCLQSVLSSDYPAFELILVDNGSSDQSVALARSYFGKDPRLRIFENSSNQGYSGGNNRGIAISRGQYLVFLNNDTEVTADWLKQLVSVIAADPSVGACQSKLLLSDSRNRLDEAGANLTPMGFLYHERFHDIDDSRKDSLTEILSVKGACFIVRREIVDSIGGFDENMIYSEDTELCWRIWLAGYRVLFVPRSVVYHYAGITFSKSRSRRSIRLGSYFGTRNRILCLITCLEGKSLISILPVQAFLNSFLVVWLAIHRRPFEAFDISQAMVSLLSDLGQVVEKRYWTQKRIRKVSDHEFLPRVTKKVNPLWFVRFASNYIKSSSQ